MARRENPVWRSSSCSWRNFPASAVLNVASTQAPAFRIESPQRWWSLLDHTDRFRMVIDRRKAALFSAAAALRLVLFVGFPSLPNLLTGRVEISTPVNSFKRCMEWISWAVTIQWNWLMLQAVQEGLFLYTHGVSPYDGGVFYQVNSNISEKIN